MKTTDDGLDEILARGRLSGSQNDAIWAKILERTKSEIRPASRQWRAPMFVGGLVGAAMLVLVLARAQVEHFGVRGDGSVMSGAFGIGCASSRRALCRPGETLMFRVNTAVAHGVLGAYAERVGGPKGGRIWYFPTATGGAPVVTPGSGTQVLAQGIEMGSNQPPGRYLVTVWMSQRPLSRPELTDDAIKSMGAEATLELEVTP